jgi:hypothetical protein
MSKFDLDLGVIDQAYGYFADLYGDVLRVSVAASAEQMQTAYVDRRSELMRVLSKGFTRPQDEPQTSEEQLQTQRKLDSLALAVRILRDPDQRRVYDRMRQHRLLNRRRSKQGHLPGHPAQVRGLDAGIDAEEQGEEAHGLRRISGKQLRRGDDKENNRNAATSPVGSIKEKTSWVEEEIRELLESTRLDRDNTTKLSQAEQNAEEEGYLSWVSHSRIIRKISDEIGDACEDTLLSVDQVFNAFTLTDKDIEAVTKRIDRAKRQMES